MRKSVDCEEVKETGEVMTMRRITVFGTGYLGAVQAACFSHLGFHVLGVDTDAAKIRTLATGKLPFFEPGLELLLRQGVKSGRLSFTTSYSEAAAFGDTHFICVATPQRPDCDSADVTQVHACIDALTPLLNQQCLVVGKSTVPVGTAESLTERMARLSPSRSAPELAWNPEFLREGYAVPDTLRPDRIVIGINSPRAEAILRDVYADPIAAGAPFLVTDLQSAELAKVAANAFLATKISYINAIAEVCEAAGADVAALARVLGYDPRIGAAGLRPGLGFGGGCLPKDIRAFMAVAMEFGADKVASFLRQVDDINMRCRTRVIDLACELLGGELADRNVAVLGLAFKPNSDDIRDSPALDVATRIHELGGQVTAYDPIAMDRARQAYPELSYASGILDAAHDADIILLLTDWPDFIDADPHVLGKVVARRNIVDGRNALHPERWRAARWNYRAYGRPRNTCSFRNLRFRVALGSQEASPSAQAVTLAAGPWSAAPGATEAQTAIVPKTNLVRCLSTGSRDRPTLRLWLPRPAWLTPAARIGTRCVGHELRRRRTTTAARSAGKAVTPKPLFPDSVMLK
jgi:UDPglucose 6-dehydrogenase